MVGRRTMRVVAAVASSVAPLAALAQGPVNTVTTGPVSPAPALGMPVLAALAVALAGFALYRLRRRAGGRVVAFGVIAAMIAAAGVSYAGSMTMINKIMISGAECMMRTTNTYDQSPTNLMSQCPNLIQILDIRFGCTDQTGTNGPSPQVPSLPLCRIGDTLADGAECRLPICV